MDRSEFIKEFLRDVTKQDEKALEYYFTSEAYIRWNNTNEQFTVAEYIRANCEYPGAWNGEVERIEHMDCLSISVARVWSDEHSFHVTSFFEFFGGRIAVLNEYWGDDGAAPKWRLDKHIGTAIK